MVNADLSPLGVKQGACSQTLGIHWARWCVDQLGLPKDLRLACAVKFTFSHLWDLMSKIKVWQVEFLLRSLPCVDGIFSLWFIGLSLSAQLCPDLFSQGHWSSWIRAAIMALLTQSL
jgi:hypothetical protein